MIKLLNFELYDDRVFSFYDSFQSSFNERFLWMSDLKWVSVKFLKVLNNLSSDKNEKSRNLELKLAVFRLWIFFWFGKSRNLWKLKKILICKNWKQPKFFVIDQNQNKSISTKVKFCRIWQKSLFFEFDKSHNFFHSTKDIIFAMSRKVKNQKLSN